MVGSLEDAYQKALIKTIFYEDQKQGINPTIYASFIKVKLSSDLCKWIYLSRLARWLVLTIQLGSLSVLLVLPCMFISYNYRAVRYGAKPLTFQTKLFYANNIHHNTDLNGLVEQAFFSAS